MTKWLTFVLGVVLCLLAPVWYYGFPPTDLTSAALPIIEIEQVEVFRRQRDSLIQMVQTNSGEGMAAEVTAALEPLTMESARWDPTGRGQFSPAAVSRFWKTLTAIQKRELDSHVFVTISILGAGVVFLLFSIVDSFHALKRWEKLACGFRPRKNSMMSNPLRDFEIFHTELVQQNERALERAVALTFALQRERLENKRLRNQITEEMKIEAENNQVPDRFMPPPPAAPLMSSLLTPTFTPQPISPSSLPVFTEGTAPANPVSAEPLLPSVSLPTTSSPASPSLSTTTSTPTPPQTVSQTPTPSSEFSGASPPRSSSISRLLSEKPVSSVEDILPYVPKFDEFTSLDQLRRRSGGVLVEIRPSLDGLLMLAQTYGAQSIAKYYTSLTMFLDRCFIAFPSDIAQDKYSIYWHSRVTDLRQDELLSTIQAEMPHLQWVGDEGVISQIELDVILHRLSPA